MHAGSTSSIAVSRLARTRTRVQQPQPMDVEDAANETMRPAGEVALLTLAIIAAVIAAALV